MEDNAHDNLTSISLERLAELEALEKKIPTMIREAITDYKKENLKKLHERDKNNPESVRLRVQKYLSKNKDKINEKRRMRRKEKQLLASIASEPAKHEEEGVKEEDISVPYVPNSGTTVRFDD